MEQVSSGVKKRINWVDYARAFAIILVVLNHAVEMAIPPDHYNLTNAKLIDGIISICVFSVGRIGVPIFLALTGYLLLDRDWNNKSCVEFWKKKWLYLLVCTEVWWIIYNIYFVICEKRTFVPVNFIKNILFLRLIDLPHVYYLPMILGMYILIPFVGTALKKFDVKILIFPMIFYGVISFVIPTISLITSANNQALSSNFSIGYSGGEFGLYILMGYVIKRASDKKLSAVVSTLLIYGSFVGAITIQMLCYINDVQYYLWYNNVFLFIYSMTIVFYLAKLQQLPKILHCLLCDLARKSFGIYLIHVLVLRMSNQIIKINVQSSILQMVVFWISSLIISWCVVTVISKIPVVGKKLFYM